MAKQNPTHLELFFLRSIRVDKKYIAGAVTSEEQPMEVVKRGEVRRVAFVQAQDLILAESALENKQSNREEIDKAKARWAEEARSKPEDVMKKKAA